MKTINITYWISTALLAAFILPGIFFINSQMALEGVRHLMLPEWFRYEVSIGQFIGGLILVLPVWPRLKEWAYVAIGIVYLSAFIAHAAVDQTFAASFMPLVNFGILLTSYVCFHKRLKAAGKTL